MFTEYAVGAAAWRHRRFRWRGIAGGLILGPVTMVSVLSTPPLAIDSLWQLPIHAAAWACFVAGAGLRFWATLYIGGRKEVELVITGPYSVCRHPLYVGSFFLAVSAGLFLESLTFAMALVVAVIVYQQTTVQVEEQVLRDRYGQKFDDYASKVPRFLPRPWLLQTPQYLRVHVPSLWNECARASRWLWLPTLGETLFRLRMAHWWPTHFHGL